MNTSVIPRRVQTTNARCRTGCVGVCLRAKTIQRKGGPRVRLFFQVLVGCALGRRRKILFRIDTLGRDEAFRRAVRARAEYEMAVRARRGEGGAAE